jgi:hypothetical protein
MAARRKALLLRVGIDRGTGGVLAPIFRDGTFEYIPIPEAVPTRCTLTYATLTGRCVPSLAMLLPCRLAGRIPHVDPDFEALTYGDAALQKRRQLLRLSAGDMLVFYAGLASHPPEEQGRLFIIGAFRVAHVYRLLARDIGGRSLQLRFGRTAHFLRRIRDRELALVEGAPRVSRLFARAVPLGDGRDCLLRDLADWGYRGSLLRSVGHWIAGAPAMRSLESWLRHGSAALVGEGTRLIPVPPSALRLKVRGRDLVIRDTRPAVGDWIVAIHAGQRAGIRAFARVNRIARHSGNQLAYSSLYWYFDGDGPAPCGSIAHLRFHRRIQQGSLSIKALVAWLGRHYRIGCHRSPGAPPRRGARPAREPIGATRTQLDDRMPFDPIV